MNTSALTPLVLSALLLCGCVQMQSLTKKKEIDRDVREGMAIRDNWYCYMPQYYPNACLRTTRAIVWYDPKMNLGSWRGLNPQPPHRVLMEARGHLLVLHRNYVWDGMTWGVTQKRDLLPTLLHDVLYHALQGGAPFTRREADRAYLRAQRAVDAPDGYAQYLTVRLFGSLANEADPAHPSIIIERLAEDAPLAPLEADSGPVKR